jgi:hypothetical protein
VTVPECESRINALSRASAALSKRPFAQITPSKRSPVAALCRISRCSDMPLGHCRVGGPWLVIGAPGLAPVACGRSRSTQSGTNGRGSSDGQIRFGTRCAKAGGASATAAAASAVLSSARRASGAAVKSNRRAAGPSR